MWKFFGNLGVLVFRLLEKGSKCVRYMCVWEGEGRWGGMSVWVEWEKFVCFVNFYNYNGFIFWGIILNFVIEENFFFYV